MKRQVVTHFSPFISVKVAQFREKLRKLRLKQDDRFRIKKFVLKVLYCMSRGVETILKAERRDH